MKKPQPLEEMSLLDQAQTIRQQLIDLLEPTEQTSVGDAVWQALETFDKAVATDSAWVENTLEQQQIRYRHWLRNAQSKRPDDRCADNKWGVYK